jgi:hypothetical protein
MNYPIDKYKSEASTTFSSLLKTFKGWTNMWQIGNVFDTLTDYVVRFPDAEPSPGAVAKAALDRWKNTEGCWYDDYGWWGIASAKAFDDRYASIFGPDRRVFQAMATHCWDVMHTGKPNKGAFSYKGGPSVWANRDEGTQPGYFTSPDTWAEPRIAEGVWQYDMFNYMRLEECSPSNPSDPNQVTLGPFQLTVMNGLYLVLALRLRLQGQGTGTDGAIKSEMGFLNAWFDLEKDESLLWRFSDNGLLVRERVATYQKCDATNSYPPVQGYHADGAWGGDQGLILGGLLDYLSVEPSDPVAQSRAISIARGVFSHMVDAQGVMPYSTGFDVHYDADDYSCGMGVFWRYLLWGFGQNAELRKEVLKWVAEDPENNEIYKSAENALSRERPGNALFADFNILATLTAAIEILNEANG